MHISWPATCTASRRSCFFTVAADAAAEFPASQTSARAPAHRDSDRRADGSVAVRTPRKEEADTIFFAEEENEKRDFPEITKRAAITKRLPEKQCLEIISSSGGSSSNRTSRTCSS